MSYYTKFADVEALLTSTTTGTILASTDALLVTSVSGGRPFQSTPGQIGSIMTVSTSSSTSTVLPPYGVSVLTGASSSAWTLADPTVRGLIKLIISSSSSSTGQLVTVASTSVTTILSSGGGTNTSVTFQGSGAGFVELVALSTTQWAQVSKTGTIANS